MAYEEKEDSWYYGHIPDGITFTDLVNYMRAGVLKYKQEHKGVTKDELEEVLESWLEHDANTEDRFDHLVPEDRIDEFMEKVLAGSTFAMRRKRKSKKSGKSRRRRSLKSNRRRKSSGKRKSRRRRRSSGKSR